MSSQNYVGLLNISEIVGSDIGSNFLDDKELLELELEVMSLEEFSLSFKREFVVAVLTPDDFRLASPYKSHFSYRWLSASL